MRRFPIPHFRDGEDAGILRKLSQNHVCEKRHIARRGDGLLRRFRVAIGVEHRQAIRIDEVRVRHAEAGGGPVHDVHEIIDVAANLLRQHRRDIVGRLHNQRLDREIDCELRPEAACQAC